MFYAGPNRMMPGGYGGNCGEVIGIKCMAYADQKTEK
jgi:hypothetical protein